MRLLQNTSVHWRLRPVSLEIILLMGGWGSRPSLLDGCVQFYVMGQFSLLRKCFRAHITLVLLVIDWFVNLHIVLRRKGFVAHVTSMFKFASVGCFMSCQGFFVFKYFPANFTVKLRNLMLDGLVHSQIVFRRKRLVAYVTRVFVISSKMNTFVPRQASLAIKCLATNITWKLFFWFRLLFHLADAGSGWCRILGLSARSCGGCHILQYVIACTWKANNIVPAGYSLILK